MNNPVACATAEMSRGFRFILQNMAISQMVMPLAARTPAVTIAMLMGASLHQHKGR